MKRTTKLLALFLAVVMLLGIAPVAAFAANPVANNLTVTNAVSGECGATVALSWQKSVDTISTGVYIYITKSYDGVNFQNVSSITSNVNKAVSYTYYTQFEDTGRTVYFGVAYGWSETTTFGRSTVSVKIKSNAVADPSQEAKNAEEARKLLLEGLADPSYTKTVENYDGYHFVVGTKAVWDCKLYTLTATVTAVKKSVATFTLAFESKISEAYTAVNGGWHGYHIIANTNVGSYDFSPDDTMRFDVNTAKVDPFGTSSAIGGTQFIEIRVEKNVKEDWFPVYSINDNFEAITKNRKVYPENAGYFTEVDLEDIHALSYYVSPTAKLNTNTMNVSQTAITLGSYGFDGIIKYRVKGAKSWSQKNVAKNKKITISGLKANTNYELQLLCKLPYTDIESGKKMYNLDVVGGKSFLLTTSINAKVQPASVQVSKVKYGTKTVKGYWETRSGKKTVWHPAEKFNTATYTLTLKLKKVPKNAKGVYVKIGGSTYFLKGNKSTYSVKMTYQHKKSVKGLKVSANLYYVSNNIGGKAVGFSPAKTISYKLKNSITKYK